MTTQLEVFADITCPFTHVGLHRVAELLGDSMPIVVRAWPLEWVNGEPMAAVPVAEKIEALRTQIGTELFAGFAPDSWPATSIPAMNLAASAYERGSAKGLAVSFAVRDALFEQGLDVSDPAVLAQIAADHGLPPPSEVTDTVRADYTEGQRRGVRGSPDFWVGSEEFFCPALDLGRDDEGRLTARFDAAGLDDFLAKVRAAR